MHCCATHVLEKNDPFVSLLKLLYTENLLLMLQAFA